MTSTRAFTSTQQKLLCDMRQDQLQACASYILHTTQLIILGRNAEQKVIDSTTLSVAQIHARLNAAIHDTRTLATFCEFMNDNTTTRHLPVIITHMCKSYIELLQLNQTAVCTDPMSRLWKFMLRTCSEKPNLLNAYEDRTGIGLDVFRERLLKFYAECLLE